MGADLLKMFERLRINCVLDVGAHRGGYAAFLRDVGYRGHIVSFEPISDNYQVLYSRCADDPKWHVYRVALGDRDSVQEMNVFHETQLCSFLTPNDYCSAHMNRGEMVRGTERVDLRRLDTIFDEYLAGIEAPRIYLKIDTQGYDLKVLAGCGRRIDQVLALQSELSVKPIYNGMVSYLEALPKFRELGFEVSGMYPVNLDVSFRVIEFDCVMVRQQSFGEAA